MSRPIMRSAAAMAAALCAGSLAFGDKVNISGCPEASTEGYGRYGAVLEYWLDDSGNGVLCVSLTNAADPMLGGWLTGFMFNFESMDPNAMAVLQPGADYPFSPCSGSAAPFGSFEAGAALGGSFLGGGSPTRGIPAGETGKFIFSIIASDAAMLSAMDFGVGPNAFDFIVRFKGFWDGASDKVPGMQICACDLNYDGTIDSGDTEVFLGEWGFNPGSFADWNGDGWVDAYDLAYFLKCWEICQLPGCP